MQYFKRVGTSIHVWSPQKTVNLWAFFDQPSQRWIIWMKKWSPWVSLIDFQLITWHATADLGPIFFYWEQNFPFFFIIQIICDDGSNYKSNCLKEKEAKWSWAGVRVTQSNITTWPWAQTVNSSLPLHSGSLCRFEHHLFRKWSLVGEISHILGIYRTFRY